MGALLGSQRQCQRQSAVGPAQILYGNLAPEGCVGKITGKEGLLFEGVARVYNSEEDMLAALSEDPQSFKARSHAPSPRAGRQPSGQGFCLKAVSPCCLRVLKRAFARRVSVVIKTGAEHLHLLRPWQLVCSCSSTHLAPALWRPPATCFRHQRHFFAPSAETRVCI